MPHDRDGNLLEVGDFVYIPCVVTRLTQYNEFCNCELESVEGMPPNQNKLNISAINTKQVVKMHAK